jgi:endonuclease YncB( thermonuclease family)
MVRGFAGAALAVALVTTAWAQSLSGPAEAIDGDTLRIAGETVRLHAIDAPEAGQGCTDAAGGTWACGAAATAALARLARGGLVCEGRTRDRYDRVVAKCFSDGADVGAALVRSGAAFAYPRYGLDYVDAEKEALFAGRGVWRGGSSRADVLRAAAPDAAAPPGCAIKGNISGNGRIFHVPGQAHYARTRISEARGERWFCSAAEAEAAGWRPARR